ncbi:MAG: M67 family metallopeptidase [Actinomycetota bacterium]|nr:M67 family metallopeptidase [Actinomycetota bacterium]
MRARVIEIPERLVAEVVARARREFPDEVCGWLAGRAGRVERTYPVANAAEDRRSAFVMDPEAQLRTMRAIREAGLELTGTYHSHPRTPSYPSSKDRQLARYPDSAHLIVSLAGVEPEIHCYRITEEGNHPVEVSIR